ncbi:MAG: HlyC/CorC family transporter [Deltaproteobacteria bacterium]|nr:HlyC/CorC family transporter [Deltaproteobacteria bacterium]
MEGVIVHLLFLIIFIGMSGIFSSSEIALVNLTPSQVRRIIKQGTPRGRRLLFWERDHDRILITIAVWNNLANIAASATTVTIFVHTFPKISVDSAAALATFATTILVLIFGEITPKLLAKRYSVAIAVNLMPLLIFLAMLIRPVTMSFWTLSRALLRMIGKEKGEAYPATSAREEIMAYFDIGKKNGVLTDKENKMLTSILRLGTIRVRDIMVNRMSMVCLEVNSSHRTVLECLQTSGYSRIPVYQGDIENIKGILLAKDILAYWDQKSFRLASLIRPATYVPEVITIDHLLRELMQKQTHMAIVVNEYGEVEGLATLEDVIEEITGDIQDEFDSSSIQVKKAAHKAWEMS